VNGQQLLNSFQFQNDFSLNDQIKPITAIQEDALVFHRKRPLSFKSDDSLRQLVAKAFFICRFEQTRPKMLVNLDASADHPFGNLPVTLRLGGS
jgi:hypothetical protein